MRVFTSVKTVRSVFINCDTPLLLYLEVEQNNLVFWGLKLLVKCLHLMPLMQLWFVVL